MNSEERSKTSGVKWMWGHEKGIALAVSLIFLTVLTLLGATVITSTTTDLKISRNYKASEQAFYAAEGGTEEGRARLRANAGANEIVDNHPGNSQWRAYIGEQSKAQGKGYDSGNGMHVRTSSLQSDLDYVVEIRHRTDGGGNVVYWGDGDGDGVNTFNTTGGENVYIITGYGSMSDANKTVETEGSRVPPMTVPAALYVEAPTTLQGASTHVHGLDGCGGPDLPGAATTLTAADITQNGMPDIQGVPPIQGTTTNLAVQAMIDSYKSYTDFSYNVTSATHTGTTTPGPGDGWGTPTPGATLQDPSTCGVSNIVYYNTNGTYIKLSGGVTGCGVLLVEGDVNFHGNFSWYGPILLTGSVIFTGGGNKQITGAVLAGGSAVADVIGGNSNVIYCQDAITDPTENLALSVFRWKEDL